MRHGLRRFVVVSALITIADLGMLALARGAGLAVPVADTVAVTLASGLSWALHRRFTLAGDPYVRWVRQPAAFVLAALLAGAIDVVCTTALADDVPLVVAKGVGLVIAGLGRFTAYRAVLLTDTRRDLRTRHDRPAPPGNCRFSVVLPAYGEQDRIGASVHRVREALAGIDVEVVVVDDGSPDATADRAAAAGAVVVRLDSNFGKGAAVRAGMLQASGRTIAFTDADLAYPPAQLRGLLEAVEDGWDVAVGNRWHPDSEALARPSLLRRASSRCFNLLTVTVLLGQYRDTQCGCKAFRADVARKVFGHARLDGFAFDVEVLHLIERYRLSLTEVPVQVDDDGASTIRVASVATGMVRDLFRVRRWGAEGRYEDG